MAAPTQQQLLDKKITTLTGKLAAPITSPVDIYNKALEGLGMADARTRVAGSREQLMNTEALLQNVAGDVQARTQDFNVSDNQRRRLVASESEPLAGQVDAFSRALQGAQADYSTILDEGKMQADLTFQGQQANRQAMMDRLQSYIQRSTNLEDKRRYQLELDRMRQQDAEAKRQFNVTAALNQQKASSSGSSSKSKSANQTAAQKEVVKYITSSGQRGSDGYVSPVTYKQLKEDWVAAGYAARDFDSNFKQYANPKHRRDYGL
jgi:hypothetical protein